MNSETHTKKHFSQTQRENPENKREKICCIHIIFNKIISRFLIRHFKDQKTWTNIFKEEKQNKTKQKPVNQESHTWKNLE